MNREAYALAMRLVDLPGGWAILTEYDLTERQREALASLKMPPLRRRCEIVGGFDDWRVHADFGLGLGAGGEWSRRGGYLARRTPDLCRRKFRDFLSTGPLPDAALIRPDRLDRLLRTPTADWGAFWSELRKVRDEA